MADYSMYGNRVDIPCATEGYSNAFRLVSPHALTPSAHTRTPFGPVRAGADGRDV